MFHINSVRIFTTFTALIEKHCGAIQYYWAEATLSRLLKFSSKYINTPAGFRIKQQSSNCDKYAHDSTARQPNSHINNYIKVAFPCRHCPSSMRCLTPHCHVQNTLQHTKISFNIQVSHLVGAAYNQCDGYFSGQLHITHWDVVGTAVL